MNPTQMICPPRVCCSASRITPSCEYPFVLVPEDHPAFRDHASAKRHLKKEWAAQQPAERVSYFLAKVECLVEPDYEIRVHQEPICPQEEEPATARPEGARTP
jgi:hypothetical protein